MGEVLLPELKVNELREILKEFLDIENPPSLLILGIPGVGKSSIVKEVAEERGIEVIDVRLAQIEYADLAGIPKMKENSWEYLQNEEFLKACDKQVVLFFDELTQSRESVLSAVFRIILDRELTSGKKLHPRTLIVAAGNDDVNDNFITELPFALLNRFFVIRVKFDEDEFLKWASKNLNPQIYKFLSENKSFTYSREMNLTPRRWAQINKLLLECNKKETVLKLLPISLRKALERYLMSDDSMNLNEIIENPESLLSLPPSEIEGVIQKIADLYVRKEIKKEKFIKLLKKIPKALRSKILVGALKEKLPPSEAKEWWEVLNS